MRNWKTIEDYDYQRKTVLLRLDINSPIHPQTKKIVNENRIKKVFRRFRSCWIRGQNW